MAQSHRGVGRGGRGKQVSLEDAVDSCCSRQGIELKSIPMSAQPRLKAGRVVV